MAQTAKLFMNGRSQAIRLPAEFRFIGREVFIEKQGGIKLIYIDPPFDVGADFSMDISKRGMDL